MIDTHCHVDLFNDPIELVQSIQDSMIQCVAVTMLPSHYKLGQKHLKEYSCIHPALGMHPLRITEGRNEVDDFLLISKTCEFIGEIGLDFSKEGKATKQVQLDIFSNITSQLGEGKFVTVHSRNAHEEVLNVLEEHEIGPVCFHYFTGGISAAKEIAELGHYFSINHRMLMDRHKELIEVLPQGKVLVESDGPFISKAPLQAVKDTYIQIGEIWGMSPSNVETLISDNFKNCRTR